MSTDRKTLLLGLLLGNGSGLLLLVGGLPISRRFLETAFPYSALGYYAGDLAVFPGLLLGGLISPAVLTWTAKRYHLLWGLFPLGLLLLWIAAGSFGSLSRAPLRDNLLPLSGHLLALFYGAGMCWLIASIPIAVFRPAWQRRREMQRALASAKPQVKWIGAVALLTPVVVLALLGWYNFKHPLSRHFQIAAHWTENSEARVPLLIKHGGIFVMASLNGEPHLCKIDTGSDTVQWIRGSRLTGSFTGEQGQVIDAMGNGINTDTVIIPYMQIGSYKITNLPTERLSVGNVLFPTPPDNDILLGNPAFDLTVLTIDYQNKMMIIRPPSYDFQKVQRHQGDRIVQMGWTYHQEDTLAEQQVFGWPALYTIAYGKPFWCVLDTGWEGPELGLSEDFAHQTPALKKFSTKPVPFSSHYATSTALEVPSLEFQIPCLLPPHTPAIVLQSEGLFVSSPGGGQGVVGTYLMERYRITMDYQRQRILLEPYAKANAGPKQEKRQAGAKQRNL